MSEKSKEKAMVDADVVDEILDRLILKMGRTKYEKENKIVGVQITMDQAFSPFLVHYYYKDQPEKNQKHRKVLSLSEFSEELKAGFVKEKEGRATIEDLRNTIKDQLQKLTKTFLDSVEAARVALDKEMVDWWPATNFLNDFKNGSLEGGDFVKRLEALVREWLIERKVVLEKGFGRIKRIEKMVDEIKKTIEGMSPILGEIQKETNDSLKRKSGQLEETPGQLDREEARGEFMYPFQWPNFDFKRFSLDTPTEVIGLKGGSSICCSQGGISRNFSNNDYAAFGQDGSLVLFDGLKGTVKAEKKLQVNGTQFASSSVEFSPNGAHLLVSICVSKKLQVLNVDGLSEKPDCSWEKAETQSIQKARWMSDDTILAAYKAPGKLVAFKLGRKEPLFEISVEDTRKVAIRDFDFTLDKKEAFCASENKFVFRVEIKQGNSSIKWKHSQHTANINTVRLSPNGRLLLSGADDQKIVMANPEDGSILAHFGGFTESIDAILWHPSSQLVFASSESQLVSMKIDTKEKTTLELLEEKKNEAFGNFKIYGLNGYWGDSENAEKPFILFGDQQGHIYKSLFQEKKEENNESPKRSV